VRRRGEGRCRRYLSSLAAALALAYTYFVELERSRLRTVGLRLAGLEVGSLYGRRPSRVDMIVRLITFWLGPANGLLDLFWIPSDPNRQSLRDKFAGTYVIKKGSAPAGHGRLRYAQYFFLGMNWAFREIERPGAEPSPAGAQHRGS